MARKKPVVKLSAAGQAAQLVADQATEAARLLAVHDDWEKEKDKKDSARLDKIWTHIETLNRELGETVGEIRGMKFMMGGGFLVTIVVTVLLTLLKGA